MCICFFFFKQKTAYEMRISDWSSDVCSSDLRAAHRARGRHHSVALAEMPNPSGCVHVMVEVNQLTDVGRAYDRLKAQGVKLMATLGEHENDRIDRKSVV